MTSILLIGINHNDPFGRKKVYEALLLAQSKSFIPDCIAVEWKSVYAQAVIAQRNRFADLLAETFPSISETDLCVLANSLAFEADAHTEIYPDLPILWLDEDRIVPSDISDIIDKYAEERVKTLRSMSADNGDVSLHNIEYRVIQVGNNTNSAPSERDDRFTKVVERAVSGGHEKIVCVVGALHTDYATQGMFGAQLLNKGYTVFRYDTTNASPIWESQSFMTV